MYNGATHTTYNWLNTRQPLRSKLNGDTGFLAQHTRDLGRQRRMGCTRRADKMIKGKRQIKSVLDKGSLSLRRWLYVWWIWHTFLETIQECRSHHLTGWIKLDFRETRVSRLFSVHRETKMPWRQTPSRKKKAVVFTNVTTNAYQG